MNKSSDYQLGQKIGSLIAAQAASKLPPSSILSQVQDLVGADTALLGPLRDLLARPTYRQLCGEGQQSVLVGGREALLQDLATTYHPAVLERLAVVIDGSLGLPPGPSPSSQGVWPEASQPANPYPYPSAPHDPRSVPSGWGGAPSQVSQPPPWAGAPAPGPYPPQVAVAPPAAPASGASAVTALLVALVSLLTGAVLLGLGWALLSTRQLTAQSSASPGSAITSSASSPQPTPKGLTSILAGSSNGAWGSASDYKFGQLPGGAYPNSCAFSKTDAGGRTTTDKSTLEFWACRDVGGNPESGYRVVWADGKETNYTFAANGDGMVVGTNGSMYPMRWRNDSHQGEQIVVINHQDGAITWIPGHID